MKPRDHHKKNSSLIVCGESPQWLTDYFGEYDTRKFADSGRPCAHCGRRNFGGNGKYSTGALSGECYLGLCADCWISLLWHCMEVANRQIDRHPEKWKGSERPDGLWLALYKIKRNIQLGTFDLLCAVAIDGAPNTRLKEAQKEAVRKERNRAKSKLHYQRHREKVRARQKAYRAANLEKCRECSRRWAKAHLESRRANHRRWNLAHRDKVNAYKREWTRRNRDKLNAYKREWTRRNRDKVNAYRRKWVRKKREEMRNGQQDV